MASVKEGGGSSAEKTDNNLPESDNLNTSSDSNDGSASGTSDSKFEDIEAFSPEFDELCSPTRKQYNKQLEALYYKLRTHEMDEQLDKVDAGKESPLSVDEFDKILKFRLELAEAERKLRLLSIENAFRAEEQAAQHDFKNKKIDLFGKMKKDLEGTTRNTEDELNSVDFDADFFSQPETGSDIQNCPSVSGTSKEIYKPQLKRKNPAVNEPYSVCMLKDEGIVEDLAVLETGLLVQKNKEIKLECNENI